MNLKNFRDLIVVVVVVVLGIAGFRWLTAPGVSAKQAHTIDSLRVVNKSLDSTVQVVLPRIIIANARVDSVQRVARVRAKRDSTRLAQATDSLEALIPDTATVVLRDLHDRIVANKDSTIVLFHDLYHQADDSLTAMRHRSDSLVVLLGNFQRQNNALIAQVNDLEGKAGMGIFRRVKVALPFVAATYGGCKLKLIQC